MLRQTKYVLHVHLVSASEGLILHLAKSHHVAHDSSTDVLDPTQVSYFASSESLECVWPQAGSLRVGTEGRCGSAKLALCYAVGWNESCLCFRPAKTWSKTSRKLPHTHTHTHTNGLHHHMASVLVHQQIVEYWSVLSHIFDHELCLTVTACMC